MIEKQKIEMSADHEAKPIVENPRRPEMSDRPPRPRRIAGKVLLMADEPPTPRSSKNRMSPVPKQTKSERQRAERPDQLALEQRRLPKARRDGYVRLHVHVEDGAMSVQDIVAVEGPLVPHEPLHGDFAWEALVGGTRVASGSIPDAGIKRSFPHPDPAPGQEGHYFTAAPSFDFLVRLPKDVVTESKLRRIQIPIYRIKEGPLPQTDGPEPLGQRFERELREVGRLRGVDLAELPKTAQTRARRALR